MSYTHLTEKEREILALQLVAKQSKREIARQLGRNAASICREIQRNSDEHGNYRPIYAHQRAHQKRHIARKPQKLASHAAESLWTQIRCKLERKWSPHQISGWLARTYPEQKNNHISPTTIYQKIDRLPKGELKQQLTHCLRQGGRKRRSSKKSGKSWITTPIHERPADTELRQNIGHFEGDLLLGSQHSSGAVGVLYERTSRRIHLIKLDGRDAFGAYLGFSSVLKRIPKAARLSMTYDQGSEMAEHARLTTKTGIRVYFCDPHSPWQRGGVENTNGLLRQYLPKGCNMSEVTQSQLNAIAWQLNERPRAILNWRSPNEVWTQMLKGKSFEKATNPI